MGRRGAEFLEKRVIAMRPSFTCALNNLSRLHKTQKSQLIAGF